MKNYIKLALMFYIIFCSIYSCGGAPATVKPEEKREVKVERKGFTISDVVSKMKIFGTGHNFYGVVTPARTVEGWKSMGNPPHWLVFDVGGRKASLFEGILFKGVFNVSRINIYIKNGNEYVDKIILTNIGLTNGSVESRLSSSGTNLVLATRLKIEFEGTNVMVSNIAIYGILSEEKEMRVAKEYRMGKKEEELLSSSGVNFGQKKFEKAIRENEAVIRIDPENPYPYMNLGQIWQAKGESSKKHENFIKAMEISIENYEAANREDNPERLMLVERLARIYQDNLGNSEKAAEKWKEYIELMEATGEKNGDNIASALVSGIHYINAGYDPAFETVMYKVIELVEKGEVSKNNFDVYLRMVRYENYLIVDRKDYEKAVRVARLGIENFPDIYGIEACYHHLAVALMALGRLEEAIEAWKGYVDHSGKVIDGFVAISYCYLKLGNSQEAYNNYVLSKYNYNDLYKRNKDIIKIYLEKGFSKTLTNNGVVYPLIELNKSYKFYEITYSLIKDIKIYYKESGKINDTLTEKDKNFIMSEIENYLKGYDVKVK